MQKGQPNYLGNRALRDAGFRSPFDTPLGARFRAAGFITLGKTNLPEFGLQSTTQPLAFGATRNPWALDRSTSGSSGGSCAAVAAGMVPVAHANDGGGSIRLPAAWCGLVGLKPSRGRISEPLDTFVISELVVSRTVRDVAAVLDAVQGSEPQPKQARNAREDRGVRRDLTYFILERFYATRAYSHVVEVTGASHSVYESHPKEVAALIEEAAQTSQN